MTISNELEQSKYQLLDKLMDECQTTNDFQQQELAINQIVTTILRSRPLCRRFHGTPLKGVYQEIYDRAKEKLIIHLYTYLIDFNEDENFNKFKKIKQLEPNYLYQLQKQIFQQLLDDDLLKKMGLAAQNYSVNSELRTYALTELIKGIKLSGRLCRPHVSKFSSSLYPLLYEEAVTETFAYICVNIDLYDPQRGNCKFMNWVNFKLDKLVLKSYIDYQKYAQHEVSSFAGLEQIRQPVNTPDLWQILQEYLTQDPDRIFATAHIRNRPDANFSSITLAKFSGKSWEQISDLFGIPIPTLSSFYNRWCRRFSPLLKTELKKYF
ncbi:hypothetical protein I4641_18430 [Waterburya agarophytonicola K14]|uniref:Uncharacterized protein n=1 Tax=Waterburya agarophytonicola KI4 TaxID=2874699 RepID=A0A964FKS6_9CYAN|nr:hypothetical protein [Waterburya agarophytonicola]MCC0178948.1 hypothetical protein [Waterburya agarophytonicola KI4]